MDGWIDGEKDRNKEIKREGGGRRWRLRRRQIKSSKIMSLNLVKIKRGNDKKKKMYEYS